MSDWLKIIDEAIGGDPFKKVVECDGKRYVLNEAALIEAEERNARSIETGIRMGWGLSVPPKNPNEAT